MDVGRLDDLSPGDAVDILARRRRHADLVARFQLIEVAKQFSENVVVRRKHHVPGVARVRRGQVLALKEVDYVLIAVTEHWHYQIAMDAAARVALAWSSITCA